MRSIRQNNEEAARLEAARTRAEAVKHGQKASEQWNKKEAVERERQKRAAFERARAEAEARKDRLAREQAAERYAQTRAKWQRMREETAEIRDEKQRLNAEREMAEVRRNAARTRWSLRHDNALAQLAQARAETAALQSAQADAAFRLEALRQQSALYDASTMAEARTEATRKAEETESMIQSLQSQVQTALDQQQTLQEAVQASSTTPTDEALLFDDFEGAGTTLSVTQASAEAGDVLVASNQQAVPMTFDTSSEAPGRGLTSGGNAPATVVANTAAKTGTKSGSALPGVASRPEVLFGLDAAY
ncbi:MAG: hypothetical protein CVU73_07320 [Deltaproteobacteria bacterium HGW-Deltaproteobacteria-8]|jgi:hypothetical protein|nr:MAG: hypothetical protein CVU73_07320 [Deltaproteobacteria bacterium HGW-Deltaproteobacteria-8]